MRHYFLSFKYLRKPSFSVKKAGRWRWRREKGKGSSITDSKRNLGDFPEAQWQKKPPQPIGLPLWWCSSEPQFSFAFLSCQTGQTHQISLCFLDFSFLFSQLSATKKRKKLDFFLVVLCGVCGDCWLRWCLVYLIETGSNEKGRRGWFNFIFLLYHRKIWDEAHLLGSEIWVCLCTSSDWGLLWYWIIWQMWCGFIWNFF